MRLLFGEMKAVPMRVKLRSLILLLVFFQLITAASGREPSPPCKADFPILTGADRKPQWLKTPQLLEQSSHCEAPIFPALFRSSRIEGTVILSLLVDEKGEVSCIKSISRHPLLLGPAIDAAKKWKFKPKVEGGKSVGFYGILEFYYYQSGDEGNHNSCLDGHF
jgi:TonB family protein